MNLLITSLVIFLSAVIFATCQENVQAPDTPPPSVTSANSLEDDSETVNVPDVAPLPPGPLDECDPDMIGFELVTGYVFSAPSNLLDSVPGTLMLTDCLESCQGNDSCHAVNYETGLCVLFSANADSLPGKKTF